MIENEVAESHDGGKENPSCRKYKPRQMPIIGSKAPYKKDRRQNSPINKTNGFTERGFFLFRRRIKSPRKINSKRMPCVYIVAFFAVAYHQPTAFNVSTEGCISKNAIRDSFFSFCDAFYILIISYFQTKINDFTQRD